VLSTTDRPWEGIEPRVAAILRPELPALADETVAAISAGVPAYARSLEGRFGRDLRVGVEEALRQFVEMVERPGHGPSAGHEVYVALGRGEMRAGRSLDALLSAYRIGARVAWRRLSAAALAARVDAETLSLLAESIFAYIDQLSAESVEGFAAEQSARAGESERRRRRLVRLLVQAPSAEPAAVEQAAAEVGWELPGSLAAVALPADEGERRAGRLGADVIAAPEADAVCVLVPDPDAPGRRAQLHAALGELPAALGPTVRWPDAERSFSRAAAMLRLRLQGALPDVGLVVAEEHLPALLLATDAKLSDDLAARSLEPLAGLGAVARERAVRTLRAWLDHQGHLREAAAALDVHPQTVRYRLERLRERFGDALEDPERRFELEVALRTEALRDKAGPPGESAQE